MQTTAARPIQQSLDIAPPFAFGHPYWLAKRGTEQIDPKRIVAAATVTVERTPMFEVVGERTPIVLDDECWWLSADDDLARLDLNPENIQEDDDWTFSDHIAVGGTIVDHDPSKYAPYTDLVCDGNPSYSETFYLVTIV